MTAGRIKAALDIATVVLVLAGASLWIVEPRLPLASAGSGRHATSSETMATAAQPTAPPGADAGAIASGNIFSATRAAPTTRYTPPGPGSAPTGEEAPVAEFVPPATPPRLYGTMSGPGGATALIQDDSAGAGGRLYREGDRVGQFRIEKILGNSVILRGPSGRMEIKVDSREERIQ